MYVLKCVEYVFVFLNDFYIGENADLINIMVDDFIPMKKDRLHIY